METITIQPVVSGRVRRRSVKDTIACWTNDVANYGPDIQWSADGNYVVGIGTAKPQVWQALSTRRGGEVMSADSY